jgi:Domain of unknown function (DUF4386)
MPAPQPTSRILGFAFLLQFFTSLAGGLILKIGLIGPGDTAATLLRIAARPWLLRVNILDEMVTATGVIWLGVLLYAALRAHGSVAALTAFALYVLEAVLLAVSRLAAFPLLALGSQFAAAPSASLLAEADRTLDSVNFGYTLLMLAFCPGAMLFYWLLFKSRLVPRALSLWGLLTVIPLFFATTVSILGINVPFYIAVPYIPFEFVIGLWILIKGARIMPA